MLELNDTLIKLSKEIEEDYSYNPNKFYQNLDSPVGY